MGIASIGEPRVIKLMHNKHIEQPRKRVFLCAFLQKIGKTEDEDVYLSIRAILDIWGCGNFYDEMIENLYRKIVNNPDENVCVYYDTGELNENKLSQKVLGWDIYDEKEKKFILVGGVLFQYGEMSFHT